MVAVRSERRNTVLNGGARLSVVLGEAALHRQVGGPDVMTGQLAFLAGLASGFPAITAQRLHRPAGRRAHPPAEPTR